MEKRSRAYSPGYLKRRMGLSLGLLLILSGAWTQEWVNDLLQGNGTRGTYWLSWAPIVEKSEYVLVEGRFLRSGDDYTLDHEAGKIAFAEPLRRDQYARILYQIRPGVSRPNPKRMEVPLDVNLLRWNGAELGLTGRFVESEKARGATVGLYGRWQATGTLFESLYLQQSSTPGTPTLMRLTGSWTGGSLHTSFLYTHTETTFQEAERYGVQAGKENLQAEAEWDLSPRWSTRLQWQHLKWLEPSEKIRQRWLAGIAYREQRWALTAERTLQSESEQPSSRTDRVAVEAKPLEKVRMGAEHSTTLTEQAEPKQETSLTLQAGEGKGGIQIAHRLSEVGDKESAETRFHLQAQARWGSGQVTLLRQKELATVRRAATLQAVGTLYPRLQIGGEFRVEEKGGQMRGYEVRMLPLPDLQLRLRQHHYEGLSNLQLISRQLEWQWQPQNRLQLGGSYTVYPEDRQGTPQPLQQQTYQALVPLSRWSFQLAYTEARTLIEPGRERRYLFGAQHALDPATNLFLNYQQTETLKSDLLRQASLRLGLTRRLGLLDLQLEASATLPHLHNLFQDSNQVRYGGSAKLGLQF